MRGTKLYATLAAMFMAGAFLASPELSVYAVNTVLSTDIKDGEVKTPDLATNAVTAAKIKDGEVKAAEIATDAVGAAEIQGVTKFLFGKCVPTNTEASLDIAPGDSFAKACSISGVVNGDYAVATLTRAAFNEDASDCFAVTQTNAHGGAVDVKVVNVCDVTQELGKGAHFAIMVYNK